MKPETWHDERIQGLSRDARLLFVGMVTMADDEGRFRARRSMLVGSIFPGDDDAHDLIDGWVARIKDTGLVVFYMVDGHPYGAFRHWRKHQKINRPTPSDLPPPPDPKVVRDNRVKKHGAGSERNGSAHESLTESSVETHSSTRRRAFRSDPIQIRSLCERLAEHIKRNDPKADPHPDSDRWLTDMRLLVADRDGDYAEVRRIIDWCQTDSFWHSNILSPAKLRKQFTQLVLKAQEGARVIPIRRETASDWLREDFIDGEPITDAQVVGEEAS